MARSTPTSARQISTSPSRPFGPGSANSLENPLESAGPRRLWEDSHQASAVIEDRIHIPGRIQLIAGGRYDSLRDHNYSAYASCTDFTVVGACDLQPTDKPVWLPQFAVTFNPVENLTLYSNYGVMLSLGPQAPWWADNGSQFLAPFNTRQVEIGAKYEPGQRILLTTAFFHMRAPFFYPESDGAGGFNFVSQGREMHNGVELSAEGKAANWLRLNGSAAAMNATSTDTGTPTFDNKQVINVPHLQTGLFADIAVPRLRGFHLMPGWNFASRKEATRDDQVSVPSYNLFNLGARYTPGGEQGRVTFRIYADNIANKRYWSDTGASLGDTFVWLGAPATVPSQPTTRSKTAESDEGRNDNKRDDKSPRHGRHAGLPRLAAAYARRVAPYLAEFPSLGEPVRILSVSPRPLSAAGVVAAGDARVFIKRHHRSVRDREGLHEEHRFLLQLLFRGAPVPRVLASVSGETAIEMGDWTYEVHETPAGIDLYEDAISWTPFRSAAHAHSAGEALAQLHLAALNFAAPPRKPRPLVASFTIFAARGLGRSDGALSLRSSLRLLQPLCRSRMRR